MSATLLQSHIAGRWVGQQAAAALRSAVNGRPVAQTHADAIDFGEALHYARGTGLPALLAMDFQARAARLKALGKYILEHKDSLYALSAHTGATRTDSWIDIEGGAVLGTWGQLRGGAVWTRINARVDTGSPVRVPVGEGVLGRIFDVTGTPVDGKGPVPHQKKYPIHRAAPALVDQDTKMRDIAQEKLADDQFALVTNYEGHTLRQYPIRNKEEVKAAAEFLKRNRSNFRFVDRNKIARKILARAHEFECDSVLNDEVIIKTAGAAIADGVTAGTFLRKVSTLVKSNPTDLKNLTIVTKSAEAMPMLPNDFALKVAGAVDDIYRDNKVNASVLPEDELFVVTKNDLLELKQAYIPFGGEFFSKDNICKLGKDTAVSPIGERATCLFSILPIKPSADDEKYARVLSQALKTAGIS